MGKNIFSKCYKVSPDIMPRIIDDQAILVPVGEVKGKNPKIFIQIIDIPSYRVFEGLKKGKNVGQIITSLINEYDASPARIEKDVLETIKFLKRSHIIKEKK